MHHTPRSLLDRIADGNDSPDWPRFMAIYRPLLRRWLGHYFLQDADADDIVQDVLLVVIAKMPGFKHDGGPGAFRNWLRRIMTHRLQTHWRKTLRRPTGGPLFDHLLEQLSDDHSTLAKRWDDEHDQHLVTVLLETIKGDFQPTSWEAFWRTAILQQPVAEAASALAISPNAVFIARSRILHRLRQEAAGLLDE